jgi:hypothetical protein
MSRCEKLLWVSAALSWGGVAAATAVHAGERDWFITLIAATVITQGAIYATFVARRLDVMYKAMLIAATKQAGPGGHPRLSLVQTGTGPHRTL